ncbi:MAG TPA: AAA family ATPase [Burkholderiales bacterium]|nr:AAA family ATPase [Burkholderiales bacterium]
MYYSYFGLAQPPFRITPNTDFFFGGGNRGPILEALIYAIGQGEGIIKVTGEVGSGKTMLCNMLPSRLPPHVETVYLANPSVSPEEILHAIAFELQIKLPRDAGRLEVMRALQDYLLERHAAGKQVVMFVEESQSMPPATLEEIRLLSNLETQNHKLLQIMLFGQPELDDSLRQPRLRQLRERITHSFRLGPLKAGEIHDYLNFRLRTAGYSGPDLFPRRLIHAIAKASHGITRRINLIADKALLAAFSENTHTLKPKHIKAAVRDSEFSQYKSPARHPRTQLILVLSLLAIGAGAGITGYALFRAHNNAVIHSLPPPAAGTITPSTTEAPPAVSANPVPPSSHITPTPGVPAPPIAAAVTPAKPVMAASSQPIHPPRENAVSADSPQPPAVGGNDTLEARTAATLSWLAQQDKTVYTIQLLGTGQPQQLKQHLNVIGKYVEINDIFVYRTLVNQKPWLTVLYGSFSDRRSALAALAALPAPLKAYRPYLRTVQGIRAETALSAVP